MSAREREHLRDTKKISGRPSDGPTIRQGSTYLRFVPQRNRGFILQLPRARPGPRVRSNVRAMSALPSKADINQHNYAVCFVPTKRRIRVNKTERTIDVTIGK